MDPDAAPTMYDALVRERIERMFYEFAPASLQFPDGLRWLYWSVPKRGRKRAWDCAYSTTKNANGKYVSWIIDWKGEVGDRTRFCEHRKRKDAKARAFRLYEKRKGA